MHAFGVIIFLALLSAALGGFLFYFYVIDANRQEVKISKNQLIFREDIYQKIINQWALDDQSPAQLLEINYSNPFVSGE